MPKINKISFNGVAYDLGGGLTEEVKQAVLNFSSKAAYAEEEYGQEVYNELYDAFYDNTWAVTANLSNAESSNTAESVEKGEPYTTIISASVGYTLVGATVSVTMNGANITSSVYNNGTINIPSVTGDVVITVVAVALTVVSISAVYTQSGEVLPWDDLDTLKADLIVTATFNDSSTEVVPSDDYTLTGTLVSDTDSPVTVTYNAVTTTFDVDVAKAVLLFYYGDECADVTGGWDTKGFNNGNIGSTSFIAENDGEALVLRFNSATGNNARSLSTINKINLSGYTKICWEGEVYNGSGSGTYWYYFPATIADSTTQNGAYGSDYSSNRNTVTTMTNPYPTPAVRGTSAKNISDSTSRTEAYISLNLNLYTGYTAGAYAKAYVIYLKG